LKAVALEQVHSLGVSQGDIKLENLLLADEKEEEDLPEGGSSATLQPSPQAPAPRRITRSLARQVEAAATPSLRQPSSALAGSRPRVVIVDFARAECSAPPQTLALEMDKLKKKLNICPS
jgi:hypothetical protein